MIWPPSVQGLSSPKPAGRRRCPPRTARAAGSCLTTSRQTIGHRLPTTKKGWRYTQGDKPARRLPELPRDHAALHRARSRLAAAAARRRVSRYRVDQDPCAKRRRAHQEEAAGMFHQFASLRLDTPQEPMETVRRRIIMGREGRRRHSVERPGLLPGGGAAASTAPIAWRQLLGHPGVRQTRWRVRSEFAKTQKAGTIDTAR